MPGSLLTGKVRTGQATDRSRGYERNGDVSTIQILFDWKREFEEREQNKSICAAVVLKYGNSASLRIRHADGQIKEIGIVGTNIFHPSVEGVALNLLHVSFVNQGFGNDEHLTAHFYFALPERIDSTEATRLAKSFFDTLGISNVTFNLREDGCFIFDTFYPYMNPFSKEEKPPTLKRQNPLNSCVPHSKMMVASNGRLEPNDATEDCE